MNLGYWSLSNTPIENMPMCPICGEPIFLKSEPLVVGVIEHPAGDAAALVHLACAEQEDEEDS